MNILINLILTIITAFNMFSLMIGLKNEDSEKINKSIFSICVSTGMFLFYYFAS